MEPSAQLERVLDMLASHGHTSHVRIGLCFDIERLLPSELDDELRARARAQLAQLEHGDPDDSVRAAARRATVAAERLLEDVPAWGRAAAPAALPVQDASAWGRVPDDEVPAWGMEFIANPPPGAPPAAVVPAGPSAAGPPHPARCEEPTTEGPKAKRQRKGGGGGSDDALVRALKETRKQLVAGTKKPAYTVASDKTLAAIASARPTGRAAMLAVPGIGEKTYRMYGAQLLATVRRHVGDAPADDAPAAEGGGGEDGGAAKACEFTAEQRRAMRLALEGTSLLITGGAGVGKSFVLKKIVEMKRDELGEEAVFITAATGIAGCHVGGVTLHSFAGIGLGKEPAGELIERVLKNKNSRKRWAACEVLVVDEARAKSTRPRVDAPPLARRHAANLLR